MAFVSVDDNTKSSLPRAYRIYSLILFWALFALSVSMRPEPVIDEIYHPDTSALIRAMLLGERDLSIDYANSLGPVFYFAYALWSIPSQGLDWLRALSGLLACINVILLCKLLSVHTPKAYATLWAAFLAGPWMMMSSMTVHGEQLALFFTLLVLAYLVSPRRAEHGRAQTIVGVVALALAPITRVQSIYLFASLGLTALLRREKRLFALGLLVLASIPTLIVWTHWGWLTPPAYRSAYGPAGYDLGFQPSWLLRPIQMFAHLGIYLSPWLVVLRRRLVGMRPSVWLVMAGVSLSASLLGPLGIPGPINSALGALFGLPESPMVPFVSADAHYWGLRLCYSFGLLIFQVWAWLVWLDVGRRNGLINFCALSLACYAILYIPAGVLFVERYVLPMYVLVLVVNFTVVEAREIRVWPFLPFVLLGAIHSLMT